MIFRHVRNIRGFFSDYYLGSVFGRGQGRGRRRRLSDRDTDTAYRRFLRIYSGAEGRAPDQPACRERFIRPLIRDVLGFHLGTAEDRVHGLFASAEDEASGKPALAVAYCGAWDEDLDAGRTARSPARLVEKALAGFRIDHGFLITGERIRLIRAPGEGPRGSFLEVDLAGLAAEEDPESFAALYRLFHASQFAPDENGQRPIDEVEIQSREHAEKVSEDLKRAVFTAAEGLVAGLLQDAVHRDVINDPTGLADTDIRLYRDSALTALYRILFILYAEARDPRLEEHRLYREAYSIHGLVEDLLRNPAGDWPENRSHLWARLKALFRIFDQGLPRITPWENIPPRGGDFFKTDTPEGQVLDGAQLHDRTLARVLLDLSTTAPRRGIGRERVSFRELDIESLGAVYEGLLEYEPRVVPETTLEVRVQGRTYALPPGEVVRLCSEKALSLRGDFAIVADTDAEALHPEAPSDEDDEDVEQLDEDETEPEESAADGEEIVESVKKGATARLVRRLEAGAFHFVPGPARKGSGSFYTPLPLVQDLVRHALGPLIEGKTAAEIERIRVLDPACGSAHFLVEAMRFVGRELHRAYVSEYGRKGPPYFQSTTGQGWDDGWEASDEDARASNSEARAWCKRRIAERCLFGVDQNPTAVNLAHVSLWVESLAGDRPLTYFEHHVRCGNSLLGTWIDALDRPPLPLGGRKRTPDQPELFAEHVRSTVKQAARERLLIDRADPEALHREGIDPESVAELDYKESQRRKAERTLAAARLLFDLRSASAFLPEIWSEWSTLCSFVEDVDRLRSYVDGRNWADGFRRIVERERFFHWETEFPEVFLNGKRPGFDVVLGNPPWDKVLPTKHEFYARHDVLIRAYKGNELDRRIRELHQDNPNLAGEFKEYRNRTRTVAQILRKGGDFPLSKGRSQAAHEDVSKYFVDRAARLCAGGGAVGLVVPSVLYNGDGCVGIRRFLLTGATIERFYGFENRKKIFPIDSRYKFANLVFRKGETESDGFEAAFMRHDLSELNDDGPKSWTVRLTRNEIERLSPETFTFLEYRTPRDQEIVRRMHERRPILNSTERGSWGARFFNDLTHEKIYNAARDKDLWTDPVNGRVYTPASVLGNEPSNLNETLQRMRQAGYWPVFEGKHIEQHLLGVKPIRWWLSTKRAEEKYGRAPCDDQVLVFRDIASNTNERTCIAAVLPSKSVGANTLAAIRISGVEVNAAASILNSFCFDYALRFRTAGTHLSFTYLKPMPVPSSETVNSMPVIETFEAWKIGIKHNTEERELWSALWAANRAVAEAYELSPDEFDHILHAFPTFARKRPKFFAFLQERLSEWKAEATGARPGAEVYAFPERVPFSMAAEGAAPYEPEGAKSQPSQPRRTASPQFQQAACLAWVVLQLHSPSHPVSRLRIQKTIYLIERAERLGLFQNYLKQAAGPYDPSLRYRGPEGIAVRQHQWLTATDGSHFEPGPNIADGARYAERYFDTARAAAVIEHFRTFTNAALERWTTVHMAACEIAEGGADATAEAVLAHIEATPEWIAKLDRREFELDKIRSTLAGLRKFGFLEDERREQ